MRKTQKTQIEQTLTLMGKVHEEIRKQMTEGRKENVLQLLNDCQVCLSVCAYQVLLASGGLLNLMQQEIIKLPDL